MITTALLAYGLAALLLTTLPRLFAGRTAAALGAAASLGALAALARIPIGQPGTLWGDAD